MNSLIPPLLLTLTAVSLGTSPSLAQSRRPDPIAAFETRVNKLMDGPNDIVNNLYIATQARQMAFAKTQQATKALPVSDPGSATISSVIVQPGAKLVANNIVIYTEVNDITVATSGARTR